MRISSFLTFIVFCFLLFMEEETEQEEAGMHLFAQLGALRNQLRYLQRDIEKREVSNSAKAISEIKGLITEVDSDTKKLAGQGGKIRKGIDIEKPVNKVQASISTFFGSANYSNGELNQLLIDIKKIFEEEIQTEVDKVIYR